MTDSTLTLALAPARTYARLRSAPASPVWRGLARRLVLIALVIGTSVTLAATASAGIALVAQATLWWSVAPLLQLLLATAVVLSAHDRPIPWARGVELMLAAHVPWSLWLLAMVPLVAAGLRGRVFLITMGLSLAGVVVWRAVLLYHFCRVALGRSRAGAIVRTLLHQATVIALLLMYAAWAIALPARLR